MLCQEDKEKVRGDKEQAREHREAAEDRIQEAPGDEDGEVPVPDSAVQADIVFARNVAIRRCTKGDRNVT